MLFGGIGGLRGGNLQPLMMGIRNYLLQKENPQRDNFLENLTQQIENFPGNQVMQTTNQPSGFGMRPDTSELERIAMYQKTLGGMPSAGGSESPVTTNPVGPAQQQPLVGSEIIAEGNSLLNKGLNFLYGK